MINMGKTKEERAAARAARKAKRLARRQKINEMIEAAKNVPDLSDSDFMEDYKSKFDKVWPVLLPALEFAEQLKVTGKKADAAINELIAIGNSMAEGKATDDQADDFQDKLEDIWKYVRMALSAATVLTNDDVDDVIDKIIGIGDWITDTDDD